MRKKAAGLHFETPLLPTLFYVTHQPPLTVKINIVIADDHQLFRCGVAHMLSQDPCLHVVAEAGDGLQLLQLLKRVQPHIILLDMLMPELDGLTAARAIKQQYPHIGLLALSMTVTAPHIAAMRQAGAGGYLSKDVNVEELIRAIKTVHGGGCHFCPSAPAIADPLRNVAFAQTDERNKSGMAFCEKDVRILELLAGGDKIKTIAALIYSAGKTVEHRIERMKKDTESKSIAQLVAYAFRHGIIKAEGSSK